MWNVLRQTIFFWRASFGITPPLNFIPPPPHKRRNFISYDVGGDRGRNIGGRKEVSMDVRMGDQTLGGGGEEEGGVEVSYPNLQSRCCYRDGEKYSPASSDQIQISTP